MEATLSTFAYNFLCSVASILGLWEFKCCGIGMAAVHFNGDGKQIGVYNRPRFRGLSTTPSSTLPME